MPLKVIADTFTLSRDSAHLILLKTIKKPRTDDQVWVTMELIDFGKYGRAAGQKIIEVIEDVFFEDDDKASDNVYERFEGTLKEINLVLKQVQDKKGLGKTLRVNAILAVLSGNHLYLTQSQKAEAYLIRGGKCSLISDTFEPNKNGDIFTTIASGDLRDNDKIIFSTQRLLRFFTNSQLIQTFTSGITEALDTVKEAVLNDKEASIGVSCVHTKIPYLSEAVSKGPRENPLLQKVKGWATIAIDFIMAKLGRKKTSFNQNTILVILVAVILLLVISVSLLMDSSRNRALREEYRLKIEALNQDLYTASAKGYTNDKESANAILDKVDRDARTILDTNYFRPEALALLDKVQENRDSINNTKRVKGTVPLVDLSEKKADAAALGFMNLDDHFYAFEYNTLFETILSKVLDPKIIDEKEIATAGTAFPDGGMLLFLTQSGRVIEYVSGRFSYAGTEDPSWQAGTDLIAYGKNIYILSPAKNQIYKYTRLRSRFSAANEYNKDADLKDALSLAADGNIYVLKQGGQIVKLFKGSKQNFSINDMGSDISKATQIFTAAEMNNIYFLDPTNKRVVLVRKDPNGGATYKGQILLEDVVGTPRRIYVDSAEQKLYLLTDSKIYALDL
ncbi:hypothetical protein HZA43_00430 [Candidatus Peregrinibacteria bacterium]|nr:hypothetical protein [Candidatus Peregrinibacteria bacterium]